MRKYTIENKPDFKQDEIVEIDMSCFGFPHSVRRGIIVGKSFTNVIDNWLVEFDSDFAPTYPFKVCVVPHTFILIKSSLF